MGDAGDLHGRARRGDVGDIAGELAEGPFPLVGRRVVADDPLDHDLGRGGHLEVDGLAAHQLGGLAPVAAHDVPLADAGGDGRAGEERHDGVPADDAGDRHGLAAGGVLEEVLPPVLAALDQEERRRVRPADHAAVDAHVHHAGVRVAGDDAGKGVDVAAALEVVPPGDGELRLVDLGAAEDDVLHRSAAEDPRRHHFPVLLHHILDQLRVRGVRWEAERQGHPAPVAEAAGEEPRAAPRLVALDVLEQEGGPLLLEHAARDGADLAVPVDRRRDPAQLALLVEERQPLPQVHESHQRLRCARGAVSARGALPRTV